MMIMRFPTIREKYTLEKLNQIINVITHHLRQRFKSISIDCVCSKMYKLWAINFTFQAYTLPHTLNGICVSLFNFILEF